MLIGYSMPTAGDLSLHAPGGAWLTADAGAACVDGKPARRARFRWRSDAPAIGNRCAVQFNLMPTTRIRIAAILGLRNVPAGAKVWVLGKRAGDPSTAYDFGMGSTITTVRQFADGTLGAWWVLPTTADPVEAFEVGIFNALAGATWATAATTVDVGEVVAMPAVDVEIEAEWVDEPIDPTESSLTVASQPSTVRRQAYRRLTVALPADSIARVRAGGLANGMDWARLRAVMAGDRRVVAIPRWRDAAGAVDLDEVNRTALYGTGRMGGTGHLGGDYYRGSVVFQEAPAIA